MREMTTDELRVGAEHDVEAPVHHKGPGRPSAAGSTRAGEPSADVHSRFTV